MSGIWQRRTRADPSTFLYLPFLHAATNGSALSTFTLSSICQVADPPLCSFQTLNGTNLPLTFLFMQLVIAVVLIQLCNLFKLISLPPIDPQLCKDIAAVVVVNVVGLVFNTLCLKAIDASYFQVGSRIEQLERRDVRSDELALII